MYLQVSVWILFSPACRSGIFSLAHVNLEGEDYLGTNQLFSFLQRLGKNLWNAIIAKLVALKIEEKLNFKLKWLIY